MPRIRIPPLNPQFEKADNRTGCRPLFCSSKQTFHFRRAAERGDARTQELLGEYYETGAGVEADMDKAVALYTASYEQHCPEGTCARGPYFEFGSGTGRLSSR